MSLDHKDLQSNAIMKKETRRFFVTTQGEFEKCWASIYEYKTRDFKKFEISSPIHDEGQSPS